MLADPDVAVIYNPLPNSLHAEWTIKASEAGKHVLCEKPLANTVEEVNAMTAAAKRADVVLTEVYYQTVNRTCRAITGCQGILAFFLLLSF